MTRAVKFSYTWGLLYKDHSVKFPSTSQSVRELDSPGHFQPVRGGHGQVLPAREFEPEVGHPPDHLRRVRLVQIKREPQIARGISPPSGCP